MHPRLFLPLTTTCVCLASTLGLGAAPNGSQAPDYLGLLRTWTDSLVARQVKEGDDRGGIYCEAHQFSHGRCADAIYPMLAMYRRTQDTKYLAGARELYAWMERHVSQSDGSWTNEAKGKNTWKGITCFTLITLTESLRHYGDLLSDDEKSAWRERVRRGAEFLLGYMTKETGDINYMYSSAAAFALAGSVCDEPRYHARARELAAFAREHVTENGLIWGEGERGPRDLSARGLRPIDIPYNVAESIPNLAVYAQIEKDDDALRHAAELLQAHLPWMLPDGGWDAGWCTRLAKWNYWSSLTSDGSAAAFALLQTHDRRFAEAARRNLALMAADTQGGMLHAGRDLARRGLPSCSHVMFTHARGLALALDAGLRPPAHLIDLPSDAARGVRLWPEANVLQIAHGDWRGSVTWNDIPHTRKRGGHPAGGAPSMIWHRLTGPLCVASMTEYIRYEGANMSEATRAEDKFSLTPRIEATFGETVYSNVHDLFAAVVANETADGIDVRATGVLRNHTGSEAPANSGRYTIVYRFRGNSWEAVVETDAPDAHLVLPILSAGTETWILNQAGAVIVQKPHAIVTVQSLGENSGSPVVLTETRVFNFVPGMEALPLRIPLTPARPSGARITVAAAK